MYVCMINDNGIVTKTWSLEEKQTITKRGGPYVNTLRTGDADLRFYVKTVQDG